MTIRLLADYDYGRYTIPAGAVVEVFDVPTENGLIAAKLAVSATGSPATWTVPVDVPSVPTNTAALPLVNTALTPAEQSIGPGVLCRTAAGAVVVAGSTGLVWSPVSGDGVGGVTEVVTFPALPTASTATPGKTYAVTGNLVSSSGGAFGTKWVPHGSVWRPDGYQVLWHLTAQADGVSGGSTLEQRLASILLPAGLLIGCREIILRTRWLFSGADANVRKLRARLGTTDTSADAIIATGDAPASWRYAVMPVHGSPAGTNGFQATLNTGSANTPDTWVGSTTAQSPVPVDLTQSLYLGLTVEQGVTPTSTASLSRAWLIVS